MKVTIKFKDDYVDSLYPDINGNYELPDDFDMSKAFFYHLVDNQLILDEDKANNEALEDEKRMLIDDLKQSLQSSNTDMLEFLENIGSLNNPLTFVSDLIKLTSNFKKLISERKSIRDRIKELGG